MAFNKCQCKCKLNIHKNMSAKKVVFGILCVCVCVCCGGGDVWDILEGYGSMMLCCEYYSWVFCQVLLS